MSNRVCLDSCIFFLSADLHLERILAQTPKVHCPKFITTTTVPSAVLPWTCITGTSSTAPEILGPRPLCHLCSCSDPNFLVGRLRFTNPNCQLVPSLVQWDGKMVNPETKFDRMFLRREEGESMQDILWNTVVPTEKG